MSQSKQTQGKQTQGKQTQGKKTMTLGPFRVRADGALEPVSGDPEPKFTYRWRNRTVHVRMLPGDRPDWRLQLRAPLTRMPSSARASEGGRRLAAFALLRDLPGTMPDGWSIGLTADHRVVLEAERHAKLPLTATSLISEITLFLLALSPYLDVFDEAGLPALPDASGTART
jgi:hypothetical protein